MNDITKRNMPNTLARVMNWEGWLAIFLFLGIIILIGGIVCIIHFSNLKQYPYGDYELTYRVYYDANNIKEYTVTHDRPIMIRSHEGTNEVYLYQKGTVIETNAPIEKVRYINKAK
jgi:hypothetical protein